MSLLADQVMVICRAWHASLPAHLLTALSVLIMPFRSCCNLQSSCLPM